MFLATAPPAFRAGGRGKTFWVRKSSASASWLVAILWRCAAVWLRVFGNCAGCAKLRAGGQNLDSDSETKCATIRLGRVFLVMAPPTLRAKAAKTVRCFWQRRCRHLGRAGGAKLFGFESQATLWLRVFGNCVGCAKLRAGGYRF